MDESKRSDGVTDHQLDHFEWVADGRGTRNSKYPWGKWQDGATWSVDPEDYDTSIPRLRSAVTQRAGRRGSFQKVRTTMKDGRLIFQFYDRGDVIGTQGANHDG